MKKVLVGLMLGALLTVPAMTIAQNSPTGSIPTEPDEVWKTINTVINWAFAVLILGAVLVIVLAAYLFLTAAGDADKVAKARNYVLYALIAIVVAFLAKALISLVASMLGVDVGSIIL